MVALVHASKADCHVIVRMTIPVRIIQGNIKDLPIHKEISDIVLTDYFPWYWNERQVSEGSYSGFTHAVLKHHSPQPTSPHIDLFTRLVHTIVEKENINMKRILRMQANLLHNANFTLEELNDSIHTDHVEPQYFTIIYYPMNSDGVTVVHAPNNELLLQKMPEEGNYLIFNSDLRHYAVPPMQNRRRVIINSICEENI